MAKKATSSHSELPAMTDQVRVCVLHGGDPMRMREKLQELRDCLRQRHGDVELFYYAGETAALADVLDELRTYSLLQTYKIVVVDDADQFVKRHREALERYVQSPVEQATLVLRSDTWNKGNLDKLIAKVGLLVKCDPLEASQIPAWLIDRAKTQHGVTLSSESANLLAKRLGSDLLRQDSELAKLAVMLEPGQSITPALIEKMVGRSSDEKAWAIQQAVLTAMASPTTSGGTLLDKLHELVDLAGQDEVPVQFAVADLMRKLAYAGRLKQRGVNEFQIAKQVGIWGASQQPFMQMVKRLPSGQAKRWFDRAMESDWRSRSGLGQPLRNLEMFFAQLTAETATVRAG